MRWVLQGMVVGIVNPPHFLPKVNELYQLSFYQASRMADAARRLTQNFHACNIPPEPIQLGISGHPGAYHCVQTTQGDIRLLVRGMHADYLVIYHFTESHQNYRAES